MRPAAAEAARPGAAGPPAPALAPGRWGSLLVLLATGAVFADTRAFDFVRGDWWMVVKSRQIRDLANLRELLGSDFTVLCGEAIGGHCHRPTAALSLALHVALREPHPAPLHLINVGLAADAATAQEAIRQIRRLKQESGTPRGARS